MFDSNCIFCKIIQKQIPSNIIKETEHVLVIKDLHPKAPYHYLIMPKKHIENMAVLNDSDVNLVSHMAQVARDLSKELAAQNNLSQPISFNLISNNGAAAGQSVFHLHWHFLAGKDLYKDGLKL